MEGTGCATSRGAPPFAGGAAQPLALAAVGVSRLGALPVPVRWASRRASVARSRVKPAVEFSVKRWPPGKPRDCVGNDRACGVALGGQVRCWIDREAMCRHVTYNGKSGDDRSAKPAAPGGSTAALFGSPPTVGRAIGTHPDSPASVLSRHSRNQCSCHNRIQCSRHNQNQCDNAPPPTLLVVLLRACSARAQHSRSAAVACPS